MTEMPVLRPLSPFGAEILGLNLPTGIDDAVLDWIETVFAEHAVLVFRDQRLEAAELAAFGSLFGHPQPHLLKDYRHPEHAMVSFITNVKPDGSIDEFGLKRASSWHTDEPWEETLPRLAMLYALELPPERGGTIFADMRAAYHALPHDLKDKLNGMIGLHGRADGPDGLRLYGAGEAWN